MLFKNQETGHTLWVQVVDSPYAHGLVHNPMDDLVDDPDIQLWSWDRKWCPDGADTGIDWQAVSKDLLADLACGESVIGWEKFINFIQQKTGWKDVGLIYIHEHSSQHFYVGSPEGSHDRWDSRIAGIVAVSPDFELSAEDFIRSYDEWVNALVWEIIDYDDPSGEVLYGLGWTEEQALEYACVGPDYELVSEDWPCSHCEPGDSYCEECDLGRC